MEPSIPDASIPRSEPARRSARSRVWLATALLLVTAAGGLAARHASAPDPARADPGPDRLRLSPVAGDGLRVEGRTDRGAVHVGGDGRVHLELTVTGDDALGRAVVRRPTDVIVVLDRSGSMSGDPLAKALAATRELVAQLSADDRFALVTYSNTAEQAVALERATGAARARWLERISGIGASGGTNMSAGLDRAHHLLAQSREPGRVARIVLLSDGHANQGDASPDGLSRRAGRAVPGEYVLSTVGVGQGFDERLMTRLADAGTGNFYYVPDVSVLSGIFRDEFASARETVASALEIRIDTPNGIRVIDAAGYPLAHDGEHSSFRVGSLFAGQQRTLWITLDVPNDEAGAVALGDVALHWVDASGARRRAALDSLPVIAAVVDERAFVAGLDEAAVSERYEVDLVNRLRQGVASSIGRGDYAAARAELESADFSALDALGIDAASSPALQQVEELRRQVEDAAAAPAAEQPKLRSELGKSLYEAGTDGRRKGSKR